MTIIVTGAAGFIGSNVVRALNARGVTDIIAVDNLTHAEKMPNLADCEIADYLDKQDFIDRIRADEFDADAAAVLHQGACSDTMASDGRYVMENNYRYSRRLLDWCQNQEIPLLYASSAAVYGAGPVFREERKHEAPLNIYGYSKFLFDQCVRAQLPERTAQIAGFRYFNVYGPNEAHKTRMASVAWHGFNQFMDAGRVKLFVGSAGYPDGGQQRDFVHVDDVVNMNLWFLENRQVSGIYNCGTGRAQTFNDVAMAVVNGVRESRGEARLSLPELVTAGAIEYVPFPSALVGRYQSYTRADLSQLRAAGYPGEFRPVEQGVDEYVKDLLAARSPETRT